MPQLREAAVAVAGVIVDQSASRDQDGKYNGQRVVLNTGDGFLSLRLKPEDASLLEPKLGDRVAWVVRYGTLTQERGGALLYAQFVRLLSEDDLDRIVSASGVGAKV